MNTNKLLAAIIVLQGMVLLSQWTGQPASPRVAAADFNLPNPGERQLQMVEELKSLNGKIDHMLTLMQSGDMQVKAVPADPAK